MHGHVPKVLAAGLLPSQGAESSSKGSLDTHTHCRFTYIPPNVEDRALMFDSELRGQMAMLMGGRAAEELTCGQVKHSSMPVPPKVLV